MKKALLSFLTGTALLLSAAVSAQNVAVNATGATADPSAMLDISAANAGLLVPRINLLSLTDAATIANPATSLLVYNINAVLGTGYYYNSGTPSAPSWTKMGGSSSEFWDTTAHVLYNVPPKEVNIGSAYWAPYHTLAYLRDSTAPYSGLSLLNNYSNDSVFGNIDIADYGSNGWNGLELRTFTPNGINFYTGGYRQVNISTNGNVGIGQVSNLYDTAKAKLEIQNINTVWNLYRDQGKTKRDVGFVINALPDYFSANPKSVLGEYIFADDARQQNFGLLADAGSTGSFNNLAIAGRILTPPKKSISVGLLAEDDVNSSSTAAIVGIGRVGINTIPAAQLDVFDGDTSNLWFSPIFSVDGYTGSSVVNVAPTADQGTFNFGSYAYADGGAANISLFGEAGTNSLNKTFNSAVTGFISQAPAKKKTISIAIDGEDAIQDSNTYAGRFIGHVLIEGNLDITGNLSKGGGTFKIDHPQDPSNKYLIHSFVESPDMMNVYNGNVVTDGSGNAVVHLPSYFQAENVDFKYQLTVIGQFAQAIIGSEVADNSFSIKTDKPNVKVSWQVTGVRNDKWAQAHRVIPEVAKSDDDKGKYLYPELYGKDKTAGIGYTAPIQISSADKAKAQKAQQAKQTNIQNLKIIAPGANDDDTAPAAQQQQQQQQVQTKNTIAPKP